ncbi:MAG: MFS transporter [Thermoleophilaceae bacterium]
MLGALSDRNFRRFFAGQAVSLFGDGMVPVALAFAVLDSTGSVSALGLVLGAQALPLVSLLLVGGVFADRLPRRAVMLGADLVRCGAQAGTAAVVLLDVASVWQLALLQAIYGAASAFFNPALTGLTPMVVPADRLQDANALRGLAAAVGRIAGPAAAGVLVATASPGFALAADAATFGVSAAALARLSVPRSSARVAPVFMNELREGWREFRARTWVVAIVVAVGIGGIPWAAFPVLGPAVAKESLGGASAWGLISAGAGVGALTGGLLALRLRPERPVLTGWLTTLVVPLPLVLLALESPAPVLAVAALLTAAATTFFNALWETALQRHIPAHALSRVSAYDWFGSMALEPVGFVVIGLVAGSLGIDTTLWLSAAALALTGLCPLFVPSVWALRAGPRVVREADRAGV